MNKCNFKKILGDLYSFSSAKKAQKFLQFFKTGKGEYGEGDEFWGITVPQVRSVVKKYQKQINLNCVEKLLKHNIHEVRLCGILFLVFLYKSIPKKVYDVYVHNIIFINNWDLVDLSAPKIVGEHVYRTGDSTILYKLVSSKNIWEKRIGIVSTFALIQKNNYIEILNIAEKVLSDTHDLIHKATGWMLREMGKRGGKKKLLDFLDKNASIMPRTMLRYAIEHFNEKQRQYYLSYGKNKHR